MSAFLICEGRIRYPVVPSRVSMRHSFRGSQVSRARPGAPFALFRQKGQGFDEYGLKSLREKRRRNRRSLRCAPPYFLWNLLALAILMRLSLRKGAYVDVCEFCVVGNPGELRSR